ncbi:hypothetical protein sos41_14740 [Alphaproteobacteria bacterium SO-S41]|nr:hypothetical protein sos41_14740 [Alphaproteobacteria bacterium SO-S41]
MDIEKSRIGFLKEYDVFGSRRDRYFAMLPQHDLSALYLFLSKARLERPINSILDVGANIGLASFCIHDLVPAAIVHAFEPSRQTFTLLERNISHNGLSDSVHVHCLAAGDTNGSLSFRDDEDFLAGSAVGTGDDAYEVAGVTLDAFAAAQGIAAIDMIKIDVEGYELAVLDGARETIRANDPIVFFECNPSALVRSNIELRDFLEAASNHLGDLYVVDRLSGDRLPIGRGAAAEAGLRAMITSHWDVFDLVNLPASRPLAPLPPPQEALSGSFSRWLRRTLRRGT